MIAKLPIRIVYKWIETLNDKRLLSIAFIIFLLFVITPEKGFSQLCQGSFGDPVVKIDFGHGPDRFGPPIGSVTNYIYEASDGPTDGFYTIEKSLNGQGAWLAISNHTPNDPDGYFMMVNASHDPGVFYEKITDVDLCANTTYEFSAYIVNLMKSGGVRPNLIFSILTTDDHLIKADTTGQIAPGSAQWKQYGFSFRTQTAGKVKIRIVSIVNNASGENGNDLAIDDIAFRACGPKINNIVSHSGQPGEDICFGQSVSIDAEVEGGTTPVFIWQEFKNGSWTDLPGKNTKKLDFAAGELPIGNHKFRLVLAEPDNINFPLCRTSSPEVDIEIKEPPPLVVTISPEQFICAGNPVTLQAGGGTVYEWEPAEGLSATNVRNPTASPAKSTLYTVHVSNGGCKNNKQVMVNVLEKAAAYAGKNRVIIEGQQITLEGVAQGDSINYFWTPSDYLDDPRKLRPVAKPLKDITYTLNVVSEAGCLPAHASVFIKVYDKLRIPNVFSPNGDGTNDVWNIPALEAFPMALTNVYNRYGERVFSAASGIIKWDGKYHGKDLPEGTYYYTINLNDGQPVISGSLTILR